VHRRPSRASSDWDHGQVVVADNGSTDRSSRLPVAGRHGRAPAGARLRLGAQGRHSAPTGKSSFMGDADDSTTVGHRGFVAKIGKGRGTTSSSATAQGGHQPKRWPPLHPISQSRSCRASPASSAKSRRRLPSEWRVLHPRHSDRMELQLPHGVPNRDGDDAARKACDRRDPDTSSIPTSAAGAHSLVPRRMAAPAASFLTYAPGHVFICRARSCWPPGSLPGPARPRTRTVFGQYLGLHFLAWKPPHLAGVQLLSLGILARSSWPEAPFPEGASVRWPPAIGGGNLLVAGVACAARGSRSTSRSCTMADRAPQAMTTPCTRPSSRPR